MMNSILMLTLAAVVSSQTLFGTTYYVNGTSGNDANLGQSATGTKKIRAASDASVDGDARLGATGAYDPSSPTITNVEAHQRYPWNGLVDIAVTFQGTADDATVAQCSFVAMNSVSKKYIPVVHVARNVTVVGSGTTWTRKFVWDAKADVGMVKIDDVALTVEAKVLGGVQLWAGGPYWAECNVGASKSEEFGYYFWWGDTVGYKRNPTDDCWVSVTDSSAFSFSSDNCWTYGKNDAQLQSRGYIDEPRNLVATHDAATAHLGAPWRMPMDFEMSALVANCTTTWTNRNGVTGMLVTGKGAYASKSIFLPAAGYGVGSSHYASGSSHYASGSLGDYWSSTPSRPLYSDDWDCAWGLHCSSDDFHLVSSFRSRGLPVRPIREFDNPASVVTAHGAVTTHLSLDCREGTRQIDYGGDDLVFDAGWYSGGSRVRLLANGVEIASGERGVFHWQPSEVGNYLLEMVVVGMAGIEVGRAAFNVWYGQEGIYGVKIHSGWPWKEVLIEYTNVGAMPGDRDLAIVATDNESGKTYECKTLEGVGYTPGTHVVRWDATADGATFSSSNVVFTLTAVKVDCVQLWEDGPYWATCNVGATKSEEYGYYFYWGDTVGYNRNASNNGWVSVKNGASFSFSSDNCWTYEKNDAQLQSAGYIDETGNLVAAHDAATAHLGAPWRMPTDAEFAALINNCTTTWTTRNGVTGVLVTGMGAYASKSIFLPAAGDGFGSHLSYAGSDGSYWSSTPNSGNSDFAWYLDFNSDSFLRINSERFCGQSVRPVRGFAK